MDSMFAFPGTGGGPGPSGRTRKRVLSTTGDDDSFIRERPKRARVSSISVGFQARLRGEYPSLPNVRDSTFFLPLEREKMLNNTTLARKTH